MEEILSNNEEREFCGFFTEAPIIEVKGHTTNAWAGEIFYFNNNDQGNPFVLGWNTTLQNSISPHKSFLWFFFILLSIFREVKIENI